MSLFTIVFIIYLTESLQINRKSPEDYSATRTEQQAEYWTD